MISHIPASVLGTCIGDALGAAFENKDPNDEMFAKWDGTFQPTDLFHSLEAGQYTDDGGMTVALAKSIVRCNGFNPENVARHYLDWSKGSYFRGAGKNTREALKNLEAGKPWTESGKTEAMSKLIFGSGPSMRISPLGVFYRKDIDSLIGFAQSDAIITHNAGEPQIGAIAIALAAAFLATGEAEPGHVTNTIMKYLPNSMVKQNLQLCLRLMKNNTSAKESLFLLGNDKPTAYLIHTNVASAFYCVDTSNDFRQAISKAVYGGWDADTNAAVTGALWGSFCGIDDIPYELKYGVENSPMLMKLDEMIFEKSE